MTFAHPLPWWGWALVIAAALALAYGAYRRVAAPLTLARRTTLMALRAVTLILLVVFLARPVALLPPTVTRDAVTPILIDASRSMQLTDENGQSRAARAAELVQKQLTPGLSPQFQVEVWAVGDSVRQLAPPGAPSGDRQSDLTGAVRQIVDRYRGRTVPGIVIVTDGGDTGGRTSPMPTDQGLPVFAIGVGAPNAGRDREAASLNAGEPTLEDASIEIAASVVSRGFGDAPFGVRLLENGRVIDRRQVKPSADGAPTREVFTVSPDRQAATLYTIEIPPDAGESTGENNRRSVLVNPPGRKRRILFVEGSPGFDHGFIKRAWGQDTSLEFDSVVRKGRNDEGRETFFVQAPPTRAMGLAEGFASTREQLDAYDAIVLGSVDADLLSHDQLAMTSEFVSSKGGGLLLLGVGALSAQGVAGTPLDELLPVAIGPRKADEVSRATQAPADAARFKLRLTPDGERHPLMLLGGDAEQAKKRWADMPALVTTAPVGAPRPGALVLALASAGSADDRALIAVQRYGRGRVMLFGGEASYRWKMLRPSTDSTFDLFWRQAGRWIASAAVDRVSIGDLSAANAGAQTSVEIAVRDASFKPMRDAAVSMTVAAPGGEARPVNASLTDAAAGRYIANFRVDQPGVYRLHAEARQGASTIGVADRAFLVGGVDPEFTDPRLDEDFLKRLSAATGGAYTRASGAASVVEALIARASTTSIREQRDLWHNGWMFGAVVLLLTLEWALRRQAGLR